MADSIISFNKDSLKLLFGLKLKKMREAQSLSLKDFSEKLKLSPSYLNEIEKGKKYPKLDKIVEISTRLGIDFNSLVSSSLDSEFNFLSELMNSPLIKSFPFELFGLTLRDIFELITTDMGKASAFIQTILNIARDYDVKTEHFYLSALRSYQEMHNNYFEDLENKTLDLIKKFNLPTDEIIGETILKNLLIKEYNYKIIETNFEEHPDLTDFRSITSKGNPNKLYLNSNLATSQKNFVLAREVAYCYLNLKERSLTSSWVKVESFEQVLNNFKASYFAGALLLNKEKVSKDIKKFFKNKKWDGEEFLALIAKYQTTPETFLYRLSELIPQVLGLKQLHYLRFLNDPNTNRYILTKELNMSKILIPQGIALSEHYCIRWLSVKLLKKLAEQQKNNIDNPCIISTQRSKMKQTNADFFCITVAFKSSTSDSNISITLGFSLTDDLKKEIKFWNDPTIENDFIDNTCERCSEMDCSLRVAPPVIKEREIIFEKTNDALNRFLLSESAKSV